MNALVAAFERITDLERRVAAQSWKGKVSHVDPQKARVRLVVGQDEDGKDVLSPWVPYAQTAGALKIHDAPSVGSQMEVSTASGDIEQGVARPLTWSNQNQAPSTDGDEKKITFGPWTITLKGDTLAVSGPKINITGDVKIVGNVDMNGGYVKADGKVIDETHVHTGVIPGGGNTGPPA